MKKILLSAIAFLLTLALLAGCTTPQTELPVDPRPSESTGEPTVEPTGEPTVEPTGEPTVEPTEALTVDDYIHEIYFQQIGRYDAPLWELWDAGMYLAHALSMLPSYYYAGNPLENVGFGLVDLDNDGSLELIIGAIGDLSVFEIWTLVRGEPVMLAQGGSDNRYVLQYVEAEQKWRVVNEVSASIASFGTYYLALDKGELKVEQGILFDAFADEKNPWFMTGDLDWDTSNDTPIDEKTATEILDSNRPYYTVPEYIPYTNYPSGVERPPQATPEQLLYARVEELSQRFGLDICVPKQDALVYSHYDAYALTDLGVMKAAVDILEENLSLYPEGFFRQLPHGSVESIRIELVGGLATKEGANLDPGSTNAFAQNMGEYYLVVFNCLTMSPSGIFHEFSHLIDARLNWDSANREDALFSNEAWLALQPEGFRYVENYVHVPAEYQVYLESGYFLGEYSMTFPTEDRAQLLAAAMENKVQEFAAGSGRRAKLQFYADCIRDCFNTEGWPETTLWEQVL